MTRFCNLFIAGYLIIDGDMNNLRKYAAYFSLYFVYGSEAEPCIMSYGKEKAIKKLFTTL